MEKLKESSEKPVWRYKRTEPDWASVEFMRMRIVVYKRPNFTTWFASCHPLFKQRVLKAASLDEAKADALQQVRQCLDVMFLKIQMIERYGEH